MKRFPLEAYASILLVVGLIIAGVNEVALILAAHNHQFALVHALNFLSSNDEFGFFFGMALLTLTTGLSILLNQRSPLPKTLGWYSILVAIVSCAGPFSGLALLFGLPIWVITTGFVVTVKARRGTLGPSAGHAVAVMDDS